MATDYKSYVRRPIQEKTFRQERRGINHPKPLPGWVWFAGGVLLGGLMMGVMWLKDRQAVSRAIETRLVNAAAQQQVDASTRTEVADGSEQSQPQEQDEVLHQFDFYSVLPDMEVEVRPDSLRPAASKTAVVATTSEISGEREQAAAEKPLDTDAKSLFQMQLASFRSRADAERMMASAALKGISSRVEKVTINDKAYYRVRSGPYSREQAYSLHKRLKKRGIESLIMRVKQ